MAASGPSRRFPVWLAPTVLGAALAAGGLWLVRDRDATRPADETLSSQHAEVAPSLPLAPTPTARADVNETPALIEGPSSEPVAPDAHVIENALTPSVEIGREPSPVVQPPEDLSPPPLRIEPAPEVHAPLDAATPTPRLSAPAPDVPSPVDARQTPAPEPSTARPRVTARPPRRESLLCPTTQDNPQILSPRVGFNATRRGRVRR